MRWFVCVQRRGSEYIVVRMVVLEPSKAQERGRPKRRFIDVLRENMQIVGVSIADCSLKGGGILSISGSGLQQQCGLMLPSFIYHGRVTTSCPFPIWELIWPHFSEEIHSTSLQHYPELP